MNRCPMCGQTVGYARRRRGARYCSRACYSRGRRKVVDVALAVALLDGTRTLAGVACRLGVSKPVLLQAFRQARVVRVTGACHRPGRYGYQHWCDDRQLSLF